MPGTGIKSLACCGVFVTIFSEHVEKKELINQISCWDLNGCHDGGFLYTFVVDISLGFFRLYLFSSVGLGGLDFIGLGRNFWGLAIWLFVLPVCCFYLMDGVYSFST